MLCGVFRKRLPVESANFTNQNLREVPPDLYQHRHSLQRLHLNTNYLSAFPKGLHTLEGLTELDISENNILFLPPTIGQLTKLKILNISRNHLPNIPDAIQHCTELISINVSCNPIGRLCDGIVSLSQLRFLFANECDMGTLPVNIGHLSKLVSLELRENHLMSLPESLGQLKYLERLDIGCNEFEHISPVVGGLQSLEELWIDMNSLISLPQEMSGLKKCSFIEASDNRLMDLPQSIGLLSSLTDLYLQNNLLTLLPVSFGYLKSLKVCNVSSNRLMFLPDSIGGLQSLTEFNLSQNHINYIPPSVGGMKCLSLLNFDENRLEHLPKEIGGCSSLTVLTLRNNRLRSIPSSVAHLTSLTIINIIGNQLSRLPAGLSSLPHITAIWIAENQSKPLLEFQLQTDPSTGDSYLTCVVFPQQGIETPYDESRGSSDTSSIPTLDSIPPPPPPNDGLHGSSVNFEPHLVTGEKKGISRDLTPYPKELHARINKWKAAKEGTGKDSSNEPSSIIQRRSTYNKINRPHSLIKALVNPVQDGSGLIESTVSRVSSLSPDLLIHLPTADIGADSNDDIDQESREVDVIPDINMLMKDQSRRTQVLDHNTNTNNNNNNNNNNNTRPPRIPSADSATSGFASSPDTPTYLKNKLTAAKVGVWSHHTHSVESGIEQELAWYQSTTPSPSHGATPTIAPPTNGIQSDGEDYDHLSKDVPSSSTLSLSAPPLSPVLSPRTVPPQPPQAGGKPPRPPLDLSSLSPVLQPSVSAKIHRGHEGSFMRALSPHYSSFHSRHYSDSVYPLKATPTSDTPPLSAGSIRRTRGSSYTTSSSPNNHNRRPYHQYTNDPHPPTTGGAGGGSGSPAGGRGQELIHSFDRLVSATPPQSPGKRGVVYTSTDGTLNRRPRASEYTDTTRTTGYKSVGSVSSAGNDSGVELLRRTTTGYVIPKSTSNSTNISYDANSLGTYEVTLKKSPTLGLGITGGKDGENAIKPGDKGFYVFRLVNNLPAAKCGKISIGDKILAVNGVDVSNLLNEQLVKLLTSEDVYVTILFAREPSITLL